MKSDNTEYFNMLLRMHKSACVRVKSGDIADYKEYSDLIKEVNKGLTLLMLSMYNEGFSICEIADEMGVKKQAISKQLKKAKEVLWKEQKVN